MRNAIRVGRLFGIDINLDFSWLRWLGSTLRADAKT